LPKTSLFNREKIVDSLKWKTIKINDNSTVNRSYFLMFSTIFHIHFFGLSTQRGKVEKLQKPFKISFSALFGLNFPKWKTDFFNIFQLWKALWKKF
jgi:hypothetical protein